MTVRRNVVTYSSGTGTYSFSGPKGNILDSLDHAFDIMAEKDPRIHPNCSDEIIYEVSNRVMVRKK